MIAPFIKKGLCTRTDLEVTERSHIKLQDVTLDDVGSNISTRCMPTKEKRSNNLLIYNIHQETIFKAMFRKLK